MAKNTINLNVNITGVEDIRQLIEELQAKLAEEQPKPNYRKIDKADAKAGDFVKFSETDYHEDITIGKYYEITEIGVISDEDHYSFVDDAGDAHAAAPTEDIVQVYTLRQPAEEPAVEPLSVGDYAKVVEQYCEHNVGDILRISSKACEHDFEVITISNNHLGFIYADKVVRATDAEVAEAKAELESEKWAKIGREPEELKIGDIVRVINAEDTGHQEGDINEIIDIEPEGTSDRMFEVASIRASDLGGWIYPEDVTLIMPVEARFDLKGGQ